MESLVGLEFWRDKKVLVTGATGLVGSRLIQELLRMHCDVTGLMVELPPSSALVTNGNIKDITVVWGDLADPVIVNRLINECQFEIVFHLGAQTIVGTALRQPVQTFESNIRGTWNLLEAIRLFGSNLQSIVVASSDKAYGPSENLPYIESHALRGEGPYDVSKTCTDLIAQSYGLTYSIPVSIARCGNIYGPGDLNWSRIVPGTIKALFHNETPILRSDGKMIRDYVFIDDIVSAYIALAEQQNIIKPGEAFNFSNDLPLSVTEIYNAICLEYTGSVIEPKILNVASYEIIAQNLSSEKAHKILNWYSRYDLSSGLKMTLPWYTNLLKAGSAIAHS